MSAQTKFNKLYIEPAAMRKINYYTEAADGEVSGLGTLIQDKEKDWIVEDIFLLEQESSKSDTELKPEAVSKLMEQMIKEDKDPGKLKFWWHCITGDTPVLLSDGRILPAKEVKDMRKPKVMAYDKESGKIVESEISRKKSFQAPTYLVKTTLNREICVTENHKMLSKKGWKKVANLTPGESIGIPGKFQVKDDSLPEYQSLGGSYCYKQHGKNGVKLNNNYVKIPKYLTSDLAKLLGWIVSEGAIDKKSNTLHITQKSKITLKKINKLLFTVFGVKGKFYKPPSDDERDRCWEIRVTGNRAIGNYLNQLGVISGRGIKRIPQCIMQASDDLKEDFLGTMVKGDGSLDKRGRILYKRIYTVYKELANDLTYLLSMLGYRAGIRIMKQNFKNAKRDKIYDIYWNSTDKCNSQVEWVEIKEIIPQGENTVYAFSVPKYRNYLCGFGPFISHNSHCDMGVFWSGTDDECAETLSKEFAFSLVVNKSGEKRCRLDLYHPFRLTIDNLKVEELLEEDSELKEKCKKEVEEKVSTSKNWSMEDDYQGYPGWHGYGRGYKRDWWDRNKQDSKVDIKECLAEDVERLMDLCASNEDIGGVFAPEVWDQYIHDTMKEIAEKRFEDDANCSVFGTFDNDLEVCKKCKIAKKCNIFTNIFQKYDERFLEYEKNEDSSVINLNQNRR